MSQPYFHNIPFLILVSPTSQLFAFVTLAAPLCSVTSAVRGRASTNRDTRSRWAVKDFAACIPELLGTDRCLHRSCGGAEIKATDAHAGGIAFITKAVADSLRDECNASGVRVCSLYLGATATPMQAAIRAKQFREYKPQRLLQPDDVASLVTSVLALPRTAEVTDIMVRPMVKT